MPTNKDTDVMLTREEAVELVERKPGIATTRTLGQSMVGGSGLGVLVAFVYEKIFHEQLDNTVAITIAGLLTGAAAYVQNFIERKRDLKALKS